MSLQAREKYIGFVKVIGEVADDEVATRALTSIHVGAATEFEGKVIKSRGLVGITKKRFFAKVLRELMDFKSIEPTKVVLASVMAFAQKAA